MIRWKDIQVKVFGGTIIRHDLNSSLGQERTAVVTDATQHGPNEAWTLIQ